MSTTVYIKILIVFILFSGCHFENGRNKTENAGYLIDLKEFDKHKIEADIVKERRFVPLEYSEQSILQNVSKVLISHDLIYVLDNSQGAIFIFDVEGKYLYRLKASGRGPQEFLSVKDFDVDSMGNILILDNKLKRVFIFGPEGIFVESFTYDHFTDGVSFLNETTFVFNQKGLSNVGAEIAHNLIFMQDKKIIKRLFDYKSVFEDDHKSMLYKNDVFRSGSALLYSPAYNNRIYSISEQEAEEEFVVDFGDKLVQNHEVFRSTSYKKHGKVDYLDPFRDLDCFVSFNNYFVNDKYLVAAFTGFRSRYLLCFNKDTKKYFVKDLGKIDLEELYNGAQFKTVYHDNLVRGLSLCCDSSGQKGNRKKWGQGKKTWDRRCSTNL